jgi:hypothetical protein
MWLHVGTIAGIQAWYCLTIQGCTINRAMKALINETTSSAPTVYLCHQNPRAIAQQKLLVK